MIKAVDIKAELARPPRSRRVARSKNVGVFCVAWEGAGAARAAAFSRLPFLELRAITDGADERAPAHFRANLRMALPNLAQVLRRWPLIARALEPDGASGPGSP